MSPVLDRSWLLPVLVAVLGHGALVLIPVKPAPADPLETIQFELEEWQPEPEPTPEPEPEPTPEPEPAGERIAEPERDPDRTSLESNRPPDPETPDEDVAPVTGLPIDADSLAPEGAGLAMRVGNTQTAGHDAEGDPSALQGFRGGGQGGGGTGGKAARGLDRAPKVLRAYLPPFPKDLVKSGVEGRVTLMVQVLPNGRAGEVEVISAPHPRLAMEAKAAVKRFRFRPAQRAGEKVSAPYRLVIHFKIIDGA